jgi:hypothetical protein
MGEPVTTGIMIGAALGGGGAALKGQDPLKGALIGGATGGIGGGFAGGFGGATGSGVGGGFTGGGYGSVGAATSPTFMQQLTGGAMGVKDVFSGANTFANQNPITTQLGLQTASSLMQPDQPMPYAPAGQIQRGPINQVDYQSLLNPQGQYVQQPISLL